MDTTQTTQTKKGKTMLSQTTINAINNSTPFYTYIHNTSDTVVDYYYEIKGVFYNVHVEKGLYTYKNIPRPRSY